MMTAANRKSSDPCDKTGSQGTCKSILASKAIVRAIVHSPGLAVLAVLAFIVMSALAASDNDLGNIFRPFADRTGKVQSLPSDPSLNQHNPFFDPAVGTNGQSCVTCHQPAQGFTIQVAAAREAFEDTDGLDPLFRPNDTADRPDAVVSTLQTRSDAYKLFLDLGVVRIGKTFKSPSDFTVEPQDTAQFGPLPNSNDVQHPGNPTLSLFRRPLVNTNVNFDSAVLWDGRDSIATLATSQVPKAIQSLLLGPGTDPAVNQAIANFMTGVFTDQVFDNGAGNLSARGALGGVHHLLALSSDPARPCTYAADFPTSAPVLTPFSSTCTPVDTNNPHTFGSDMFDAWANLPDQHQDENNRDVEGRDDHGRERDDFRASIARGQEIFNTAVLTQPPDLNGKLLDVASVANGGVNADHLDRIPAGAPIHCVTCHATHNLGNNPNPNFIGRIGTDSIDILENLVATRSQQDPLVQGILDNVKKLPLYCLRPKTDTTPFTGIGGATCGTHAGDVKTTDPGRAMVTGLIADAGKFKPPILRDLAVRSPFFHAGAASDLLHLIDFYDARFQINLTQRQKNDLANFLEAF
jgi:mono/diheme cytochrome c family protein